MRRRTFLSLLGSAAVCPPLAARAQQPGRVYRLGVMIASVRETLQNVAFFDELRLHGFIEGQNLEVLTSGFGLRDEQIPERTAAIVKAAPDVILTGGFTAPRAIQQATKTLPVVMLTEDMVASGFASSLARPGGNITGVSLLSPELDTKRLGLLIEACPGNKRMALLADSNAAPHHLQSMQDQARQRGVELSVLSVSGAGQIASAIESAKASGASALNVLATPLFGSFPNSQMVIERANALGLAAIYQWPEMAEQGGFAAYGPRFTGIFRQLARQVVRVMRGAKPTEIPVEQPTSFELVLNLKTAKAIGHEIPAGLVLRADKLIE